MSTSVALPYALLQASRPKTLTASTAPVIVAAALAFHDVGHVDLVILLLILLSAGCIQIGTNFINDALDFVKGADTAERLGPSRATQMGWLSPNTVLALGGVCFLIALVAGIPLVIKGGTPILVIGLVSLAMGYCYTGGPYPLAYKGLGDLFVLIFFGWVAVGGTYYLLTGQWNLSAFIAGSQVGLLGVVLIAVNNLRDRVQDAKVGKRTLSVRLGRWANWEITVLFAVTFLLSLYWLQIGLWKPALLPLILAPLAFQLDRRIRQSAVGSIFNVYLAKAAKIQIGFGALLALSFCLS